jgi:hypothetical protein
VEAELYFQEGDPAAGAADTWDVFATANGTLLTEPGGSIP